MAGTIHFERFDKIVSFGTDCTVALAFKAQAAKEETYPFDWIVGHYRWLRQQLDERLPWQIDGNALTIYDRANPHILGDEVAGVYYYHDFTADEPLEVQLGAVQEKYMRRADRLRELMDSDRRILFIRSHLQNSRYPEEVAAGTSQQMDDLAAIIEARYPNCDFRLLMLYSAQGPAPRHPRVTRIRVPADKEGFRRCVGRHVEKVRENQGPVVG